MNESRLNKYLALQHGISRREADDLIAEGRVTVNGIPAELGARVIESDQVMLDDILITPQRAFHYIMLNKPEGYVCSRKQQGDTPTIYALIPKEFSHLKPVGRLDKDSSGLILLTNDGDFAHQMTHPSFHKTKTYNITLDKPLEPLHQQMITDHGIQLEDGSSKLILERTNDKRTAWRVHMHEGRNRQIRRTFAALGYTVTKLHRIEFGTFHLANLPSGEMKEVTP
jgi:23S rRNA pseudouridine2605 synthase